MDFNLTHPINYNQNEAKNMVIHNLTVAPAGGLEGQFYYNSSVGQKKPYYHNGTAFVSFEGVDSYVTTGTFDTVTGKLALTRNNGLATIEVNLDGRYLTANQTISLTGHITGSGTTSIATTLQPIAVTSQPDATVVESYPSGVSYMLISQDGALKKYSLTTLKTYITNQISTSGYVDAYTVTVGATTGGATITHFLGTTATDYTQTYDLIGTANETEVTRVGNVITIGLPDNVTIGNNLTVSGNLTVNGTVTTVNTETINLADNIITLNSNYTGSAPTENGGIEIERGTVTNVSLVWNETTDRWTFTNNGTLFNNIPIPSEYNNFLPATQTAYNLTGSGIKYIKSLTTNTYGAVTSATEADLPLGTTAQVGLVELADNTEHLAGTSSSLAATPAGVAAMIAQSISADKYVTTINPANGATTVITHNLATEDVMVQVLNAATKELVLTPYKIIGANTLEVSVGINPIGSLIVKVFR